MPKVFWESRPGDEGWCVSLRLCAALQADSRIIPRLTLFAVQCGLEIGGQVLTNSYTLSVGCVGLHQPRSQPVIATGRVAESWSASTV